MKTRSWWTIILLLFIVIVVLAWFLFTMPAAAPASVPVTEATSTQPVSKDVTVTSPKSGATVTKTFTVAGSAPGQWFFEAVFPIKVLDKDDKVIATTHAQAQGDWMTTDLVTFTAEVTTTGYSGPATLVLSKDNPSGLPEHDASVLIPIIIQ